MEVLFPSAATITPHIFPRKAHKSQPQNPTVNIKFPNLPSKRNHLHLSFSSSFISFICFSSTPSATLTSTTKTFLTPSDNHHWMVLMEAPPQGVNSKPEVINYYVNTLARVLGSEKDAQMCIYHASCDSPFGFCCDIDEDTFRELARLPEVLSVRPDPDYSAVKKTYSSLTGCTLLFPVANTNHWLVRMDLELLQRHKWLIIMLKHRPRCWGMRRMLKCVYITFLGGQTLGSVVSLMMKVQGN